MMSEKKLFLLDAMALIYRAYFALNKNPRLTSKGLNTSAIMGFANTLFEVLKNEKPTHIAVAFDTAAPTQRHVDFVDYKAHREAAPEDLIAALPYIQELIEAFRIPVLIKEGYEADDIIGTIAKQAEQRGFATYMMTSDKDFGQLVSETTVMYKPAKFGNAAEVWGIREVCDKFGIERPEQVKDILGLWGDSADNIPGIPGVGEVIAKKLIAEFDSVENLIANSDKISNEKLRLKVETHKEQALLSKQLATILLDVPIEFDEEDLELIPPDRERLQKLFEELEFRTFGERLFKWLDQSKDIGSGIRDTSNQKPETSNQEPRTRISHPAPSDQLSFFDSDQPQIEIPITQAESSISHTPHHYYLVDTSEKRVELIHQLNQQTAFCFDTETTGIDTNNAELVGISFAWKAHEGYYVPIPANQEDARTIVNEFKQIFENEAIEKCGQNMKFDISILKWYDVEVKGRLFDTMLAHYLIQPDMRHNMDLLAQTYLGYTPVSIENLIGKKGKNQMNMRDVDLETIKEYAAEDADITLQLRHLFEPMLAQSEMRELFEEIEVPLVPVLASMEAEGVALDTKALQDFSIELEKEITVLENTIYELAATRFNIASPKQLGEILFDKLKIVDNPKQTKTKQYSTGEEVLTKLVNKHPIIENILGYRSLTKLKSTYVDVLPGLVSPRDGRIHTSYNQAVAATGRLSSNNPNLQNIPIRTEKGREIRKAFVPRSDEFTLLSADYSQIELRIIAHVSQDKGMIEDFKAGYDIHQATAAKVYGIPMEEVTKEMRRNAKSVNFGIIYGISAFGLSENLDIPRKEAAEIIQNYFVKYPGVKSYMENTIQSARHLGYVETMMKRRRYIRDINSSNGTMRGFAERNAINAPIQGTAADMIKIAMIQIFNEMKRRNLKSRMILQVHDELVFDLYKPESEEVKSIVQEKMQKAIELDVPVVIEMNTGNNWLEAH